MWVFAFRVLCFYDKNMSDAASTTECIGGYEQWIGKDRGE